jgi:hypothetical protein
VLPTPQPLNPSSDPASAVPRTLPAAPAHVTLPEKPKNSFEDMRSKGYYPITWRVVGGGVKLAVPNISQEYHESHVPVVAEPFLLPSTMSIEAEIPPVSPAKRGHTRTSPRSLKTMSISIPATARLIPIELEGDDRDITKARSTPASPHREYIGLTSVSVHLSL